MGRNFSLCSEFVLLFLLALVVHLEARHPVQRPTRRYGSTTSLTLHRELTARQKTSFATQIEFGFEEAAALGGRANARSLARTSHLQVRDLMTQTTPRRMGVEEVTSRQEVEALKVFQAAVSAGNTTAFRSWNASDSTPCTWTGISCSSSLPQQHVVSLSLRSQGLVGSINAALLPLGSLSFLETLDLSNNNFGSFISEDALVNFTSLVSLNVSYNEVVGRIPSQIGELANLQSLTFAYNNLSGEIPASIGNCTSLRVLNLQSNFLEGHIPEVFGRLVQLEILVLGTFIQYTRVALPGSPVQSPGNAFSGSIPSSLGNCSKLQHLDLSLNINLGGQIPEELSELRSLQVLDLDQCNFRDVIPKWLGNLTKLVQIIMSRNHFYGPIPAGLGRLHNLGGLDVMQNNVTGAIPHDLGNCTSLSWLATQENSMTGIIPSSLSNCSLLQSLSLGENPLMDPQPIPSWISSLTQLITIPMSHINLHGTIPEDIGKLSLLLALGLYGNALTGSIPPSLSNCSFLQVLDLGNNSHLTGLIPPSIDVFFPYLQFFDVGRNRLSGSIPPSITNLTQLVSFDLRDNLLEGTTDLPWQMLPELQYFDASGNQFVGSIPSVLGNCSFLEVVSLQGNQLTGGIPASFGNLSQLQWLTLQSNHISGRIPPELARCSTLTHLYLEENQLEGPFPPYLGSLSYLSYLELSYNNFTGVIEGDALGNLTALITLDLSFNQFSGEFPGQIFADLQGLTQFSMAHNSFNGSLNDGWSHLANVQVLDISANMLSGSISTLGKLGNLQQLEISFNNFSGGILESFASLQYLVYFNASYNNLAGPIPDSGAFKSNITAASFLGNAELCGIILGPSRECPVKSSNTSTSEGCKNFQCPQKWVPTTVVGLICVFLAVLMVVWLMIRSATKKARKEREVFDILLNFRPNVMKFAPADILAIIRGGHVIGTGAKGIVYKGSLPGHDVIAIKTFVGLNNGEDGVPKTSDQYQWQDLLEQEANLQARLRHRNIVKVLSFCSNLDLKALLLEYMPQGSLYDHLYLRVDDEEGAQQPLQRLEEGAEYSQQKCQLPWHVRLAIACDVAEGMAYLHHDCPEPLIHGDLKPSNVLLNDEMVAKVADFGISKLVNLQKDRPGEATISSTRGTVGYMPPEYATVTTVSTKGDVFSYGILLLETLSGRPPTDASIPSEAGYRDWNLGFFQANPSTLLDPALQDEGRNDPIKNRQMLLLARVAFLSTRTSPGSRPTMKDVRSMLNQIKDVGEEAATRRTVDQILASEAEVNEWENKDPDEL